jgi:predicted alpha/beta superfamily hydrolase
MKHIFSLLFIVTFCSCQSNLEDKAQDFKNKIIIGESFSISSKVLNENRDVFISLPSNYNRNIHSYPVVIVMDAEYLFETTSAIVKIKASRNEMPESIIVGIPNNTGKRSDMALQLIKNDGGKFFGDNGGKSKMYLDFLRKELYPFIEDNYRVNAHKTIIGMSPSFGPVLEAFWNEPDLCSGYIVLAAELSLKTTSGETVAQKLLTSVQDSLHPKASIYIGKAGDDLKRRPLEEAKAFIELNRKLDSTANPKINYKVEILENEDHYGMSISGIQRGLETMYPNSIWNIPYRDFWSSENPANEIKQFYDNLSDQYGFKIVPLENSFYASQTLLGTVRRLERQGRKKELKEVLKLAIEYYPNSKELNDLISRNK